MSQAAPISDPVTLGFLTILQEPTGWLGGYLVTNSWSRPLEFRLTTAVQPNRVQTALYGPTLSEYLHADLIGKTLVERTGMRPDLVVTDVPAALPLRSRIDLPVVALRPRDSVPLPPNLLAFHHPRSSRELLILSRYESDQRAACRLLDRTDPSVDLAEPFTRIREAVSEHRKLGVNNRAA